MKKVTGKRNKTDADFEQLAHLEFLGSLYLDVEGQPMLPDVGIEAIIRSGAKKSKEGKVAQSGVFCMCDALLEYDGPKNAEELWIDERFRLAQSVRVGMNRVIRTRPIFKEWSCVVEIQYNPNICNEEQVTGWLAIAGEQCGAFDWRPRYGRFTVEKVTSKSKPKVVQVA